MSAAIFCENVRFAVARMPILQACFCKKCMSCTQLACLVVSSHKRKAIHERRVDLSSDLVLQVTSHVAFHPHPRSVQGLRPVGELLGLLLELALDMGDLLLALEASLQLLCSRRPCTCSICIDHGVVLDSMQKLALGDLSHALWRRRLWHKSPRCLGSEQLLTATLFRSEYSEVQEEPLRGSCERMLFLVRQSA